jgi:uncharacterized protein (TIGR02145 family)
MKKAIFIFVLVVIIFFLFYRCIIRDDGVVVAKSCNGKEYDHNVYDCVNGELIDKSSSSEDSSSFLLLKCDDKEYNPANQICDSRDSKIYKTVKINKQIWMAENLNYETKGSICYGNDPANCENYGRLYDNSTAGKVCPEEWHLSTCDEWLALLNGHEGHYDCWSIKSVNNAGTKLKAKNGWNNGGNGTDDYGFAALPSGYGNKDGSFSDVGNYGGWWGIETYTYSYDHFGWYMYYSSGDAYNGNPNNDNKYGGCPYFAGGKSCKMSMLSVRCIKNPPCGKATYDPSKQQECCDNVAIYDGFHQFCKKGKVYDKCGEVGGGEVYDPETEFCYEDSKTGDYEVRKK